MSAEQIVMHAEGKLQMDTTALQKVEDHLKECTDCLKDIEIIRNTYISANEAIPVKGLNKEGKKRTPWYRSVYSYVQLL